MATLNFGKTVTLAQAAKLPATAWQRSVPLLGLPPGYCGALALSER